METASRAGGAYRRIARRLMGEKVPMLSVDEESVNFVDRFRKILKLAR